MQRQANQDHLLEVQEHLELVVQEVQLVAVLEAVVEDELLVVEVQSVQQDVQEVDQVVHDEGHHQVQQTRLEREQLGDEDLALDVQDLLSPTWYTNNKITKR